MDVRIALTDPRHDRLTLEADGRRIVAWDTHGPAAQIVLPTGDEGDQILATLARQLIDHLHRQGWDDGAAA